MKTNTTKDAVMMGIAQALSTLSTCSRRSVGCVLVDSKYRIIASGYNGVPAGKKHCTDLPCLLYQQPHGTSCFATHAEVNAIAQCQNVDEVWTVFTTSYPCIECFKLIMNTGAKRIVYWDDYPAHRELVETLNADAIEFLHARSYMDVSIGIPVTRSA